MSAGESSRAHVVEIDELACSMRRKLNYYCSLGETHAVGTSRCMIYKVPQHICEAERHAYEPIVLSIGPYHYGTPELRATERKKWNCLDYVLKLNPEKDLLDYLNAIASLPSVVLVCSLIRRNLKLLTSNHQQTARMSAGDSSRAHAVEIGELVSSMRRKLDYYCSREETHSMGTTLCMIYKVPQHIREVESHAYEPIVLSIGPYHHGSPPLQSMEKKKWKCLDYILKLNPANDLYDYLKAIATLENQVRNCYTEEIKIESKKFLRMLLLDGCFILVSLYGMAGTVSSSQKVYGSSGNYNEITEEGGIERKEVSLGHTRDAQDSSEDRTHENTNIIKENLGLELEIGLASTSFKSTRDYKPEPERQDQCPKNYVQIGLWYHSFAIHDLLLLENQIPFCVVKKIYELVAGEGAAFSLMASNIAGYIENIVRYYPMAIQESERPKDFHHLLHLCHMYFRPSQKLEEGNRYQDLPVIQQMGCLQSAQQRWHRALQYYEAGIELTKREFDKYNPHSLLDIKFGHGVLDIPCLPVDEHTSCLFRNFIAFEQTCPQFGNYFTAYLVFLSQFMSMPEDVTLLAQRGIIEHQLRSDKEVSTLFTKLSKDVVFDFDGNYYLKSIFMEMEAHYHSRLNRWMAWLRHNHFSNPWLALAALAAAVVLFCTILQTLIAVYSYMKPPSDNSNVPS